MKNKYVIRSKISETKIRQIARLFAVDLDALQIAQIAGVNRNTVNRYLAAFRERIAHFCEAESPVKGEVEVDESYFAALAELEDFEAVEQEERLLFLAYSNEMGESTQRLSPTAQRPRSKA